MKRFITLFLLVATLSTITSCGLRKTPLAEEHFDYAGKWIANDGSWLHIYNNGGGDLKEGNTSVTGGSTSFENGNIKIGVLGINKTYKIDKPPYEEDGEWKMELNGFPYVKE